MVGRPTVDLLPLHSPTKKRTITSALPGPLSAKHCLFGGDLFPSDLYPQFRLSSPFCPRRGAVAPERPFLFLLSSFFCHLPPSGEMTASRSLQAQYQGMAPLTPQGKMLLSFSPLTASTEKSDDPSCFAALIIGGMRPIVHHPCIPPPPLPAAKSPSSLPVPLSLLSLPYLGKSLCCTLGFFCPFFPSSKKKVDNGRGFLFFPVFF